MPHPEPNRWWVLALAAGSGLLTEAAFPDRGWWGAGFVGMALLFLALRRDGALWNALVGFVWGLAFFAPHITWADYVVGRVPWVALTVFEALYIALFGALWTWARRGTAIWRSAGLQVTAFVVLWVAVEELRSVAPFGGFPWGRLAFSQADSPLVRLAWLGGAPLVSAAVVAIGALLAVAMLAARRLTLLRTVFATALALLLVGVGLLVPLDTQAQEGHLRVGAVQGNVPTPGAEAFSQAREVLRLHAEGTRALLDQVEPGELDVVLWPENGTDVDPQVDAAAAAEIDAAARAVDAPMLVGTVEYPSTGGRYNTAVLWVPGEGVVATYVKQHPAPFAEYIPLRRWVRPFSSAVDLVRNDMIAGTKVGVVPLESARLERTVPLGDVICFEVAYDPLVRESVRAGAEVLVVQTNNASFGFTDESTQQLAMSRLRAIEHGRATVQISTVGVSGIIAPNGVVSQQTDLFTAAQLVASLPLRTSLTPATRIGDWLAWGVAGLAVVIVLSGMVGATRVRRPNRPEGL
ncbi:apolipoprotein N-acyltransferase [Pengzhenrongella frigida]|uniref:Apolipoprotein N-acyltransferase n=1 Tax=Pengzhenrongella frigida TaxID=1259133 RepID=A0A4Q5MYG9_9MICO|nr:apolipoprotein N-acyltransferase [Cellulomonas sp. HLT2-17]RYV50696.1 apolipoprotein N-acyltransferase [Cellulomonas sp. HLT2-17]